MSSNDSIAKMKGAHEVIASFDFDVIPLERGYAGRWLRVDVGSGEITIHPVDDEMKRLWTGGKGFDLWMTFGEIDKDTKWDSPNNPICFSSGPLGGTISFPGSGKTLATAISPLTNSIMDCNVGGYFGPFLKFAGFDSMMVTGKADDDVIVFIDSVAGRVTLEKAPMESVDSHLIAEELAGMYADNELDLRNIACVSAGRGAEHTRMGILNFSFWDWRRGAPRLKQAGRGGVGTVFRNKKIKAVVIKSNQVTPAWKIEENKVAKMITPRKISIQCKGEIAELHEIIDRWDCDPEYVTEMMQDIQGRFRHISKTAIDEINRKTGKPKSQLYHIATFYTAFSLEPKGETVIQVCMGTACHVKGSAKILDSFESLLGVGTGETTRDNRFTLEAVACIGACSIAPVVKIGEEVFGNVQSKDVEKLLKRSGSGGEKKKEAVEDSVRGGDSKIIPADLKKITAAQKKNNAAFKKMLMVCTGTSCVAAKGFDIRDGLLNALEKKGVSSDYAVVATGCNGFCASGPIVVVQPNGIFYHKVKEKDLDEIVTSLESGETIERLLYKNPVLGETSEKMGDIPFFSKQQLIALRNRGIIDPENIDHYIARGGYDAVRKVLGGIKQEDVIKEVILSGIRGRGGGGFPTGIKWESGWKSAQEREEEIFVACNADEGVPGAFAARTILETDPHSVIEGMLIGAYAVGSKEGHVYVRGEYPLALRRLSLAISQARAYGLLGDDILGSGFSFDIRVHRGAGAFVCGESSALMASMGGKPGEPRAKYVHSTECGFRDKPTVLNNVETWATIPEIVSRGAAWFASIGTGNVSGNPWNGSSGTKIFSLAGDVMNTGLVEVPMGTSVREIVEEIGGGISKGRTFKAFQTGGPPGGCLPASMHDLKLDFDSLAAAGSMLGSGAIAVMNDRTCMVNIARHSIDFLMNESCGKCTACREGLHLMSDILHRICSGEGRAGDIERLEELCGTVRETSLCQLGGTAPNSVTSTIRHFREEYEEHILKNKCRAGVCRALVEYRISEENCTGCTLCFKNCPVDAITGEKGEIHLIDAGKCIKCGICYEVCNFDAVEVI